MRQPAFKLPDIGTTIFTTMSRLAAQHGAINLGQGFPDFDPPPELLDHVARHLHQGHNQYAPMTGVEALRQQIARRLQQRFGVSVDADSEVTITSGGTEAIFCAIQAVVHAGDEVVLLDPAFDCYAPAIELAGGRAIRLPLLLPGFSIDFSRLAQALSPRTRLVIVNSPHNPSGALVSASDWDTLADVLAGSDTLLLSDEVYEHLVFDGARHASALAQAQLRERCFAVFSFGKLFNATGWKVGYSVAPPLMSEALRRVHQYVTFAVSTPVQHGLADFLTEQPDFGDSSRDFYQARRDRLVALLADSPWQLVPAAGTYFQLADYSALSDDGDVIFCRQLVEQAGVAAIPLSPFCAQPFAGKLLRFCFAKQDATLQEAAIRLQAWRSGKRISRA